MVNNNTRRYVEEEIGRAIDPYENESSLTEEEALEEYSFWMGADGLEYGFLDSDKIIYHPSPSEEEDEVRFELLEKVAFDMYSKGRTPEIYVSEDDREKVRESDILHEDTTYFSQAEVTEDDISEAFRFSTDGKSIHVTSDYHAEGVYGLREGFDDDDFIVLSADTSEIDPDAEDYAGILGPASPVAEDMFDWKTLAEGKEVGRELLERYRGPRF